MVTETLEIGSGGPGLRALVTRAVGLDAGASVRLRQLSPWFDDDDTWRLLTAKTGVIEREHILSGPGRGQDFKCTVVKLDYLLVIRLYLIDVPELVAIG